MLAKHISLAVVLFFVNQKGFNQSGNRNYDLTGSDSSSNSRIGSPAKQFLSTIDFLDASINSINSFNSLLKKEAYRIKITSFNNPTSS
ncbi:MAG: hypothetical protein WKF70_04775, partial [Chitinophagaceae bacterium]